MLAVALAVVQQLVIESGAATVHGQVFQVGQTRQVQLELVQQIKRYEAGSAQPTAEALKKLALALHASTDFLLFEEGEREPDDDMKLRFEAIAAMRPEEQEVAKAVLDAIIVKSQVAGALARVGGQPAAKEK